MRTTTGHRPDHDHHDDGIAPPGLKGLVVADTALGDVRGEEGFYHYRQYSAPELARHRTLEDVWVLLLDGHLPGPGRGPRLRTTSWCRCAGCDQTCSTCCRASPPTSPSPAAALRTALSHHAAVLDLPASMDATPDQRRRQALQLSAAVPTLDRRPAPARQRPRPARAPGRPLVRRRLPVHAPGGGARTRARPGARAVPDPGHRPRVQRLDVHRPRRHLDRRRPGSRRGRCVGGAHRSAARRCAEPGARHPRRHRRPVEHPSVGRPTRSPVASASWASAMPSTGPQIPLGAAPGGRARPRW